MTVFRAMLAALAAGLFTLLFVAPAGAVDLPPNWSPPPGMSSRCEDLLTPERLKIANAWQQQTNPPEVKVLSKLKGESPVELGKKVHFTLYPSDQVTFALSENQDKTGKYAGLLTFRSAGKGGYRISTTPYVWLEMVPVGSPGKAMGVIFSDVRLGCSGMHKNIAFELKANTNYWIQISGIDTSPNIELMITGPEPVD